jgi:hypothetical protein
MSASPNSGRVAARQRTDASSQKQSSIDASLYTCRPRFRAENDLAHPERSAGSSGPMQFDRISLTMLIYASASCSE